MYTPVISQILAGGGYSTVASLCLSAPPYLFAAIYTFTVAWSSDRLRQRGAFVALNAVVCIIGCSIIGYGDKVGIRLFGSFLAIGEGDRAVEKGARWKADVGGVFGQLELRRTYREFCRTKRTTA
jgi:hypothetical protein